MTLHDAIQAAHERLPNGYTIKIYVTADDIVAELSHAVKHDEEGCLFAFGPGGDESLAECIERLWLVALDKERQP